MEHHGKYDPMLLSEATQPHMIPVGPDWRYGAKINGWRFIADCDPDRGLRLLTRGGNNRTDEYPTVANQLTIALKGLKRVVLDGEMVGFDAEGNHSSYLTARKNTPKAYIAFDLLEFNGEPLIQEPWKERRRILQRTFKRKGFQNQSNVQLNYYHPDLDIMLEVAAEKGYEGIVAKNINSLYLPGQRSKSWRKYKF